MRKTLLLTALLGSSVSQALPVINEVDADNPSTDTAEFIELFDGGVGNTPLDGYSLVLFNGSNNLSYQAFDLDGYSTNEQGFFVLCGDAATVENCDLDVSPNSNLIQNGADAVALYLASSNAFPNGSAVTNNGLVDALVYDTNDSDDAELLTLLNAGQPQVNEGGQGDKDNHSNQRCQDLTALNTDQYTQASPTPGISNACSGNEEPEPQIGQCGDHNVNGFAFIHDIQGNITDLTQDASALMNQNVIVEAIVTMDLQGGPLANGDNSYQYSGFWIQEEDDNIDTNANTSEGIFVYDYRSNVSIGDKVRIMATVSEYNNATQLGNVSELIVCATNQALPASTTLTLPVNDLLELEALEGMLVNNQQNLVVSDLFGTGYGFGNYGQFAVSSKLHFQPTEIARPLSDAAITAQAAKPLDTLLIDDGVSAAYPSFIPFPDDSGFSALNPMRIGYHVPNVNGVLHGWRNNYTIIPSSLNIDPTAPRTAEPVVADDANLIIAGMNVLNYFNGDGQGSGFPTSRGAPTLDAFTMQTDKIVAALEAMNADVIALMEIENDGYQADSAIQQLVNALNTNQLPENEYRFINPGISQIGTDEITVGLLYRWQKLQPVGNTVILDSSNSPLDEQGNPLFIDDKNRPSLIQSFSFLNETFTLSVNHLKSKGSACNELNEGTDGQGNCNLTRTQAALALTEFLADSPTGIATDNIMILGDLNAYSQEDPMQVFYQQGYQNLKYTDKATEEKPFSYSFSGFLGSLDHALATASLSESVLSVDAWHINSVEAPLMDYLTEANGQTYSSVDHYANADPYRSSDHDPIIVALKFGNHAPEFTQPLTGIQITSKHQTIYEDLSNAAFDADGDTLVFSSSGLPQGFALSETGILSAELSQKTFKDLPATVTIYVSDGKAQTSTELEITDGRKQHVIKQAISAFIQWLRHWLWA